MTSHPIEPTEVEKRNSFDLKTLDETLTEMKERSFYSLYQYQRDITGFIRFDVPLSSLKKRKAHIDGRDHVHMETSVKYNFVPNRKRFDYKRSKLFKKELSFADVATNYKMFNRSFMVFIEGRFVDNVKIRPNESETIIIFDLERGHINGFDDEYIDRLVVENESMTILFTPNGSYGSYETRSEILQLNKDNLNFKSSGIIGNLNSEMEYMAFVNSKPELFFESTIIDEELSKDLIKFDPVYDISDSEPVHLNVFGFSNLKEMRKIPSTSSFIRISDCDMPVPTENIVLFKVNKDGHMSFAHDIRMKLYYTNVYEIINNTDDSDLVAFIFYSHDSGTNQLKYRDDLRLYRILMNVTPENYQDKSLSETVMKYDVERIDYNHPDYSTSIYFDNHLKYKLNKLKELTEENPTYFTDYLRNLIETVDGYYIDMSTLDYDVKKRVDNKDVVNSKIPLKVFDDERILIIVKNENGVNEAYRFYIDGSIYDPKGHVWSKGIYLHYYIPSSIVKRDSIIEIERFAVFQLKRSFTPSAVDDYVQVSLKEDVEFFANDIYVIDRTTDKYLIPDIDFKISLIHSDEEHIDLPVDSFREVKHNTFLIRFINEKLIARQLTIYAARTENLITYQITTDSASEETFKLVPNSFPDKRHFRVFRNGRLLPQDLYSFYASRNYLGGALINPSVLKLKGDTFTLDYTPHRYKIIHSSKTIPRDGLVDLKGKITKPLDLKWFDIYLNGRKLNKNQVFISTPTVMTIYNVKSLNNLLILERDRDEDILSIDESSHTIIDTMIDENPEFRIKLTTQVVLEDDSIIEIDPIESIEDDIITEIIEVVDLELKDLYDQLIRRLTIVNPDLQQLTDDDYRDYKDLFYNEEVYIINADESNIVDTKFILRAGFESDYNDDGDNSEIIE